MIDSGVSVDDGVGRLYTATGGDKAVERSPLRATTTTAATTITTTRTTGAVRPDAARGRRTTHKTLPDRRRRLRMTRSIPPSPPCQDGASFIISLCACRLQISQRGEVIS